MKYINQYILERYIQPEELIRLTDDENTGQINQERLNEAINAAENEFESYMRGVFSEPLPSPLPDMLIQIICDITIYNLYKRRFRLDMPESIVKIYEEAIDKLVKIRKGLISIIDKEEDESFIKTNKDTNSRIFPINEIL